MNYYIKQLAIICYLLFCIGCHAQEENNTEDIRNYPTILIDTDIKNKPAFGANWIDVTEPHRIEYQQH